jgi:hypothetical protein
MSAWLAITSCSALLEELAGELRRRAGACRGVRQLARVGLGHRDELLGVLDLEARARDQVHLRAADAHHRRQVARGQDGGLEQRGIGRLHRGRRDHHRVAVGRGLDDLAGGDVATGAGLVVDDHGLAQRFGQALRDQAGHHVGGAAGGEADDDAHALVGPGRLSERSAASAEQAERRDGGNQRATQRGVGTAERSVHGFVSG